MNFPLHRFALFGAADANTFRDVLCGSCVAKSVRVADATNFSAAGNLAFVRSLALGYGKVSAGVTIDYPAKDLIRLQIALCGRSLCRSDNCEIEVSERQLCVTSAGQALQMQCDDEYEWISLCVEPATLRRKLEAILGDVVTREIEFEPATSLDHPDARSLKQQLLALARHLDAGEIWSPLAMHEWEQSILAAILTANRHNYTPLLQASARNVESWQVRRLASYIEANWNRPITIEKLVPETSTDVRSLFRAFRRSRGCTPRAFATMIRLKKAREMLSAPGADKTLKEVSTACGFPQFSQFVAGYLRMFGERPHATLARTTGQILAPPRDAGRDETPSDHLQRQATIQIGAGIACTLHKMSGDGATIEVRHPSSLPIEFRIRIEGELEERYCAVVWRGANRTGVIFV